MEQFTRNHLLAILRIAIGLLFLWPFFDKMFGLGFATPHGSGVFDGGSPSSFVVYVTDGLLKDFYTSLAGNAFVDFMMMAALLLIGISLVFGIASKLGTIGCVLFMMVMYTLVLPPTDNPVLDDHIIMILAMLVVYYFGGFEKISFCQKWKDLFLVKRFPILE